VPQVTFQFPPLTRDIRRYLIGIAVTYLVVVLVYLLSGFNNAVFVGWYFEPLALTASDVLGGRLWQLVTYPFVYAYPAVFDAFFAGLMIYFFGSMLQAAMDRRMVARALVVGLVAGGVGHVLLLSLAGLVWPELVGRPVYGAAFAADAVVAAACWRWRSRPMGFFGVPATGKGVLLFFIGLDVLMAIIGDATRLAGSLSAIGAGVALIQFWTPLNTRWTLWKQRRKLRSIRGGKSDSDDPRKWMN